MKVFVSGGCKNGKSFFAQCIAKEQSKESLYYIATMKPGDSEDLERIERHRDERKDWGFKTLEVYEKLHESLKKCDAGGSFLLDSTTALLANEMFGVEEFDFKPNAYKHVSKDLSSILREIDDIVIVSDFIFADCGKYDEMTEAYRYGLAYIDRVLAKECEVVVEVASGMIVVHKGKEVFKNPYEKIY